MDVQALCRFRQTCKYIDELVEKHRFSISSRRENTNWVFLIRMGSKDEEEDEYELKFSINRRHIVDFGEDEYSIQRQEEEKNFNYKECFITDPYVQLSAVSLRAVHVVSYF